MVRPQAGFVYQIGLLLHPEATLHPKTGVQQIAFSYVQKITTILRKRVSGHELLLKDTCQLLIYYIELYQATEDETYHHQYHSLLEQLENDCPDQWPALNKMGFRNGLAGVAYTLEYLQQQQVVSDRAVACLTAIDQKLYETCLQMLQAGSPLQMLEAYGILHYFLLKTPTPAASRMTAALLKTVTVRYQEAGIEEALLNPVTEHGRHAVRLGLYKGLSGLLLVLLEAIAAGYGADNPALLNVVGSGVQFLLKHRLDINYEEEAYSFFPESVYRQDGTLLITARLGWQSSDLNEILLLYKMFLLTGQASYRQIAAYMGMQTVARRQYPETMVRNTSIYDGTAGIALFYGKLYRCSNLDTYAKAYDYWVEQTILLLDKELELAKHRNAEADLLKGLTGVSLMLLQYWRAREGGWTRMLFL